MPAIMCTSTILCATNKKSISTRTDDNTNSENSSLSREENLINLVSEVLFHFLFIKRIFNCSRKSAKLCTAILQQDSSPRKLFTSKHVKSINQHCWASRDYFRIKEIWIIIKSSNLIKYTFR